jgi:hypothetical protein
MYYYIDKRLYVKGEIFGTIISREIQPLSRFNHKPGLFLEVIFILLTVLALAGCKTNQIASPTQQVKTIAPTPVFTPVPSPTEASVYIPATVWKEDPQIPILVFHRFIALRMGPSNATKVVLEDFQNELQGLYDAGYSLVSLQDWIEGDLSLPAGRKALAITIDDAFFGDQISLDNHGIPLGNTGLGILWQFAQLHPDFGFKASLFANFGDKYYGDLPNKDWFIYDNQWKQELGNVIAWCLNHNVGVYNHLYMHPRLDLTRPGDVHSEVAKNDAAIRNFLTNSGHADSIQLLHNIIALPYGIWPPSKVGVQSILNYIDPDGRPVEAIFEAGSYTDAGYLQSPYSKEFDPMHIPRINGSVKGVNFVIQQAANFPKAESCLLGPLDPARIQDSTTIENEIQRKIDNLNCLYGVYSVAGRLYESTASGVQEILLAPVP